MAESLPREKRKPRPARMQDFLFHDITIVPRGPEGDKNRPANGV